MQKSAEKQKLQPAQSQKKQPGIEKKMAPRPEFMGKEKAGGRLEGKVAIITGGDSGIGRAVAVAFAKEGADVCITYLDEHEDAAETREVVEKFGRRCLLAAGDISSEAHCSEIVKRTFSDFGRIDILVNNAAVQFPQKKLEDITAEQLERTFKVNIFSYFYMAKAVIKHLKKGGSIINTTSVTAYRGSAHLVDYASTKGAIVAFTRSLSSQLAKKKIRVNGVAPGPIWTPLIPASFPPGHVAKFGSDVPLARPGQPEEVAPCYVFLASEETSYMTGQILHPNGGEIVNG
ncbi:MAG TPA: SDR family oxidoreductase [Anseongella sp.]|nr:SDR family oxidoreductase [Anseongella sp.]